MIEKVKHFLGELSDFSPRFAQIAKAYGIPAFVIKLDSLYCRFRYGSPVSQYIGFGLYQLNRHERNMYVTDGRTARIEKALNHAADAVKDQINYKHLFNETCNEFVHREWIYAPDSDKETVRRFLEKNDFVFAKPDDEKQGKGIERIESKEVLKDLDGFYIQARQKKYVLEQLVRQHPGLSQINPTSINTIRVCTLTDKEGNVNIFAASLRGGGKDSFVDNFHAGGAQYPLDVSTGMIIRGGVRFDGVRNIWFHPSTNFKMIGYEVPNWKIVLETVDKAASLFPGLRYIAWDVAVTEDGCELIEANLGQGCNGMQQDGIGKYKLVKQYF